MVGPTAPMSPPRGNLPGKSGSGPGRIAACCALGAALIALSGCASPDPFPRCVAQRFFADDELTFCLCPYADDIDKPVHILDVRFEADGAQAAVAYALEPGDDDCRAGQRIRLQPPLPARRDLKAICAARQGRWVYRVEIPFARGLFRDGRYRWRRGDARIELIETLGGSQD
jgi:hypothetical protein